MKCIIASVTITFLLLLAGCYLMEAAKPYAVGGPICQDGRCS
jgi:hypothetical protein